MSPDRIQPAEVFPPGEFIREELEARGWRQSDLAEITGRSIAEISRIINGKTEISKETAQQFGVAFETGPEYWLNLQLAYSLATLPPDIEISEKSRVFNYAPISQMRKRGWIKNTDDVSELKSELYRFFRVHSLDTPPPFAAAARKYDHSSDPTSTQAAWLARARQVAESIRVSVFDKSRLPDLEQQIRRMIAAPSSTHRIGEVFAEYGVRFVVVEPLPGGKIDGAAFWLDSASATEPVIAISFRFDRIDAFWFTVAHEYAHILYEHGFCFDNDLAGIDRQHFAVKAEEEQIADKKAAQILVPQRELDDFIRRVGPYYSKAKINQFANRVRVHPGVIVGQLQYRGELPWTHLKALLLSGEFRNKVVSGVITDGWGREIDSFLSSDRGAGQ
jgi:HTH-type transcriptional regulator/antitoxin HigA